MTGPQNQITMQDLASVNIILQCGANSLTNLQLIKLPKLVTLVNLVLS